MQGGFVRLRAVSDCAPLCILSKGTRGWLWAVLMERIDRDIEMSSGWLAAIHRFEDGLVQVLEVGGQGAWVALLQV